MAEHEPPAGYTGFERFHDDPDAPFYRSARRNLSPQATWLAVQDKLRHLVERVHEEAGEGPIRMSVDRIQRWHRFLFAEDFREGGVLRHGPTYYPVRFVDGGRTRQLTAAGSEPGEIEADLEAVCDSFNVHIDHAVERGGRVFFEPAVTAAAELYAGILRVHPYADGNARVAYVALQAALRSQGVYAVWFDDLESHELALGQALRPDAPTCVPLAGLLIERVNASSAADERGSL